VVDFLKAWGKGISNPELAPLPPNILKEWGYSEGGGTMAGLGTPGRQATSAGRSASGGASRTARRSAYVAPGSWLVLWDQGGGAAFETYCSGNLELSATGAVSFTRTGWRDAGCYRNSFSFSVAQIREVKRNTFYGSDLSAFHIKLHSGDNYNLVQMEPYGEYTVDPGEILSHLTRAVGATGQ
jgi:hypothetical protein